MYEKLQADILACGAAHVGIVNVADIDFDPSFRTLCEQNACGMYGRCWQCPPDCGAIDALIERARSYTHAVVYQTIDTLEDSYDFEGMMEAGERMNRLSGDVRSYLSAYGLQSALLLGAGACRLCERCSKSDNEPCRFPEQAVSSLEAYGVNVSELAVLAGMKYINGINTVTYFGAVLLKE